MARNLLLNNFGHVLLGQNSNAEETLRQAAQRIDQVSDATTQANLMATTGILAGLKLEDEIIYRVLRRDIEGKAEKQREIAINLLQVGIAVDVIASTTGLSLEVVQQLQQQITSSSSD